MLARAISMEVRASERSHSMPVRQLHVGGSLKQKFSNQNTPHTVTIQKFKNSRLSRKTRAVLIDRPNYGFLMTEGCRNRANTMKCKDEGWCLLNSRCRNPAQAGCRSPQDLACQVLGADNKIQCYDCARLGPKGKLQESAKLQSAGRNVKSYLGTYIRTRKEHLMYAVIS